MPRAQTRTAHEKIDQISRVHLFPIPLRYRPLAFIYENTIESDIIGHMCIKLMIGESARLMHVHVLLGMSMLM